LMYRLPAISVFLAAAAFQPSVEAQMRSAPRPKFPARVRSSRLCLLIISAALVCSSCGVCSPPPFVSSISPSHTTAGGNQFVLTVNGSDFRHDSSVSWNGSFRVTTFVSSHQLEAAIAATDIAQPGMVLVFVFNPPGTSTTSVSGAIGMGTITSCSAKNSNAVSFTIGP
jgi:IPT/TIG domain